MGTIINEKLSIWFDQNLSISKIVLAKTIHILNKNDELKKEFEKV